MRFTVASAMAPASLRRKPHLKKGRSPGRIARRPNSVRLECGREPCQPVKEHHDRAPRLATSSASCRLRRVAASRVRLVFANSSSSVWMVSSSRQRRTFRACKSRRKPLLLLTNSPMSSSLWRIRSRSASRAAINPAIISVDADSAGKTGTAVAGGGAAALLINIEAISQIGVMLPNLIVNNGDRHVRQIQPGLAPRVEDRNGVSEHLRQIAIDSRAMSGIGTAQQIRNRLTGRCEQLAINPWRTLCAGRALVPHLFLILGEKAGKWLVFAAKIPGQVLLRILLLQIPLAVMHEA